MTSGETVLVTAAAGGAGQFAVQLAKLAGNHVIGTCSSDDKVAMLKVKTRIFIWQFSIWLTSLFI